MTIPTHASFRHTDLPAARAVPGSPTTVASRYGSALLYVQVALLFAITFLLGRLGVGAIRYGFIVGCGAIGYQAWRRGPAKHVEMVIILFVWAPFLRRVTDFSAGFDPSAFMLVGPVLATLPPCLDLYAWLVTGRLRRDTGLLGPFVLMGLCLLYGFAISIGTGDILPAVLGLTKFLPGLLYGLWLMARGAETPNVIDGATRGFMIAMPAAGLYGIYQYFYLPDWDSYWINMTASMLQSQGVAEAGKLRVFGPMNSVASYGHFLLAGVLLLSIARRGWISLVLCLPMITGMMLSTYRTSWIALAVAIGFCCLQGATRRRAQLIAIWIVAGAAIILTTTPLADTVLDRMATFSAPSEDGSGKARLAEYAALFSNAGQFAVGLGIGGLGPFGGSRPRLHEATGHVDGSIVDAVLLMGLAGGSLYLLAVLWASAQAVLRTLRTRDPRLVAVGAIVIGNSSAMLLSSITRGEVGILFWAFVGMLSAAPLANSREEGFEPSTRMRTRLSA